MFTLLAFGSLPWLVIVFSLATIYGWLVVCNLIYRIIQIGPKQFFYVKNRQRPSLIDETCSYGHHKYLIMSDGIQLHYVDSGHSQTNESIMIFLHGFPECWFSWRHQLKEFRKSHRTIAVSLRGFADSDKPTDLDAYNILRLVNDCREWIQHLSNDQHESIILVSHDWGGIIAWYFAMLYPQLIIKLIIVNAIHPTVLKNHIQSDCRQLFQSWFIFLFQLPLLPELMFHNQDLQIFDRMFGPYVNSKDELEVYKYYYKSFNDFTCSINHHRAFIRGYGHSELMNQSKHSSIQVTTLLVWSDTNNQSLAAESAQQCHRCIVRIVNECSHWIPFEKADELNAIITRFVDMNQ